MDKSLKFKIEQESSGKGLEEILAGLGKIPGVAALASAAVAGITLAVGALTVAFVTLSKASLDSFAVSEMSAKSLEFALTNTTASLQEMLDLSSELQTKSMFSDEQIQDGITFLALNGRTEEQIKKTTKAAVDFAAANKIDLDTAFKQLNGTYEGNIGKLGKLDGSIKNLTKEQLAAGDAVDVFAQKYSGFAENQATTTLIGQWTVLKNLWDDNLETLGSLVAQGVKPLLEVVKQVLPSISTLIQHFVTFAGTLLKSDDGVGKFLKSIKDLIVNGIQYLANLIEEKLFPAFESFVDTVKEYYEKHGPALIRVYETIGKVIIEGVVVAIETFLATLELIINVADKVVGAIEWIGGAAQTLTSIFSNVVGNEWIESIKNVISEAKSFLLANSWLQYVIPGGVALYESISQSGAGTVTEGEGKKRQEATKQETETTQKIKKNGNQKKEKEEELDDLQKIEKQLQENLDKQTLYISKGWNIVKLLEEQIKLEEQKNEILYGAKINANAKSIDISSDNVIADRDHSGDEILKKNLEEKQRIQQEYANSVVEIYNNMAAGVLGALGSFYASFIPEQDPLTPFQQLMKNILLTMINAVQGMIQLGAAAAFAKGILTGLISLATDTPLLAAAYVALELAKGFISGFREGGHTGGSDSSKVAGVVHENEWVAPSYMAPLFPMFESMRLGMRSGNNSSQLPFMSGGYTNSSKGGDTYLISADVAQFIKKTKVANRSITTTDKWLRY